MFKGSSISIGVSIGASGGGGGGPAEWSTLVDITAEDNTVGVSNNSTLIGNSFTTDKASTAVRWTNKWINTGSCTGNIVAKVYATSSGVVTGSALGTSNETIDVSTFPSSFGSRNVIFTVEGLTLSNSTEYAIVVDTAGVTYGGTFLQTKRGSNPYAGGQMQFNSGGGWSGLSAWDVNGLYELYG